MKVGLSRISPTKNGDEPRDSGRLSSSCSTIDTRRVNLDTNPVISHEWGNNREVFTKSGTYPWSFVTPIFHSGQSSHGFNLTTGNTYFGIFQTLLMKSILPRQSLPAKLHQYIGKPTKSTWYKIILRFYLLKHTCIVVNIRYTDIP
jgi:hypothetical protein